MNRSFILRNCSNLICLSALALGCSDEASPDDAQSSAGGTKNDDINDDDDKTGAGGGESDSSGDKKGVGGNESPDIGNDAGAGGLGGAQASSCGAGTKTEDGDLLIIAKDGLNYTFESSVQLETVEVQSLSDLTFDWSGVTVDMMGHDFDPLSGVDMMELMIWRLSAEDLIRDISNDTLDTGRLLALGLISTESKMNSATFFDLGAPGGGAIESDVLLEYVDTTIYPREDHTYLLMLAQGDTLGQGTRMMTIFDPHPDSTNTEVRLSNDSTTLQYKADLTSLERVTVPTDSANIVFDWQSDELLKNNAMGQKWLPTQITDVHIGHYLTETPESLEDNFLDLEMLADETYSISLSAGQSVHLSRLENEEGTPFSGISDEGTWVITLGCGRCTNPAPHFLTILAPCSE